MPRKKIIKEEVANVEIDIIVESKIKYNNPSDKLKVIVSKLNLIAKNDDIYKDSIFKKDFVTFTTVKTQKAVLDYQGNQVFKETDIAVKGDDGKIRKVKQYIPLYEEVKEVIENRIASVIYDTKDVNYKLQSFSNDLLANPNFEIQGKKFSCIEYDDWIPQMQLEKELNGTKYYILNVYYK
jgi:hypothetical protein